MQKVGITFAPQWSGQSNNVNHLSFPDSSLIRCLISLYFENFNLFVPVLHRPTFEDALTRRLHTHQEDFASTLLLVCALGILYLTDPGMSDQARHNLAWGWYDQVQLCGHSLSRQPTTYDLQAYCLAAHFILCVDNPRSSWLIVGFGLRLVQDMGGHLRNLMGPTISIEEELEKRVTWALVVLDGQLGATLGRTVNLNPFDLGISFPSEECDDEWWPGPRNQPRHTPSYISFFNCIVDLHRLQHFLVKNLNSTSRLYTASDIEDLQMIAEELDAKLNQWFGSIPQHLIWNPESPDGPFFDQSASLYCFYHYMRILIHRGFIPLGEVTKQSALRSFRICTKAARTCIRIADIHRGRRADIPLFLSQDPLFASAMVLILRMWGRSQHADQKRQDLAHVRIVINLFTLQQSRWPSSGFYVTVLERLLALDYTPLEQPDELSDTESTTSDDAAGERLRSAKHAPEKEQWVAYVREWLDSAMDQHPHPHVPMTPPVFAGDQEVALTEYHRLRVAAKDVTIDSHREITADSR
ncbi:fungal-specific transcription factor domain-containing protein [Mycena galopus ATCC 62051]|nr:fungal-specific transcription factor domain-containing protein [Mycena galopus ATCC 62051]